MVKGYKYYLKRLIILSIILLMNFSAKAQIKTMIDTLRVSILDTTLFVKHYQLIRHYSPLPDFLRQKSKPYYNKKFSKINDAYYIISNEEERTVTEELCINDICETKKHSSYTKAGRLQAVRFYEKSGSKLERLNKKGIPKKISYFDEKGNLKKDEYYSRGKLKKIRNYTFFNKYTTEYIK